MFPVNSGTRAAASHPYKDSRMLPFTVTITKTNFKISSPIAKLTWKVRLWIFAATAILSAIVPVKPFVALFAFFRSHLAATAAWAEF